MLKLKARRALSLKCPNHPRHNYSMKEPLPSCDACLAIIRVAAASADLETAERRAERWISRGGLKAQVEKLKGQVRA